MAGTEFPTPQGAQQHAEVAIQIQYPERPSADARCQGQEGVRFQCTHDKPGRLAEAALNPAEQNNKHTRSLRLKQSQMFVPR